jgi:hypothetical protein
MTTIARRSVESQVLASRTELAGVAGVAGVAGGVDTHRDTHTAAVVDAVGRLLGHRMFPATAAGYKQLLVWLRTFGTLLVVGVEGTGAYGAGLTRYLTDQDVDVVEVDRPDRKTRRWAGKSDPIDAEAAARAALAGTRAGIPKDRTGAVEALRNLRVARRSAVGQRADCVRRIKTLIVTAPEPLRDRLRGLSRPQLVKTCAGLRAVPDQIADPLHAAKIALRSLARRHHTLSDEIAELDALIDPLVSTINPPTAPAQRCRRGRGRPTPGQRRAERPPTTLRGGLRHAVRRRADPRIIRPDPPPPPQPRRRPPGQRGPAPHRHLPTPLGPTNSGLPQPPHHRGPHQQRHHPLPQTADRPGGLPRPHRSTDHRTGHPTSGLTSIGASRCWRRVRPPESTTRRVRDEEVLTWTAAPPLHPATSKARHSQRTPDGVTFGGVVYGSR